MASMGAPFPFNPFLTDTMYQDAKTQFDTVKAAFNNTWSCTLTSIEYMASIIHKQTLRIRTLEGQATELENNHREKTALVTSLEAKVADITQDFEGRLAEKQRQLVEAEGRVANSIEVGKRAGAHIIELRRAVMTVDKRHKQALQQVDNLQQTIETLKADQGQKDMGPEGKMAAIEGALKKELEARSDTVRQAALAVAKEAADAHRALQKAYNESQARAVSLETQLRMSREVVAKMTQPSNARNSPPVTSADGASPGTGTPLRIISGTYRPKLLQPSSTLRSQPMEETVAQSPPTVTPTSDPLSSAPQPSPPSPETAADPAQTTSREVIDLTFSPVGSPGTLQNIGSESHAARPAKRQRVDSDLPKSPVSPPHFDDIYQQKPTQDISPDNPVN